MADSTAPKATTPFDEPPHFTAIRDGVRAVCADLPDAYWRDLDARWDYPEAFVQATTAAGWLGALIPKEYGGPGPGMAAASVILEGVNHQGGNAGPAHAQMYIMGALLATAHPPADTALVLR